VNTLVFSLCFAVTAIVMAWGAKIIRGALQKLVEEIRSLWLRYEGLSFSVKTLNRVIHAGVAIDVGLKDRGWLILCCRVAGIDRVMIQHLKPDMTMKEYKELVDRLSYDFQHVAYIDAPHGYESFLKRVKDESHF
jgi:hypothetical protein